VQFKTPGNVVRPFERASKTYEAILARYFADPTLNVSFRRISKILFRQIYQQTGGDVVAASLLTGTDHYLASVRRHYCTPRVGDLQGIYGRAITSVARELSAHTSSPGATGIPIVTSDEASIGSPICPTDKSLAKAFKDIREAIRRLKNAPLDRRKSQFQRRHNLYTLYSVLAFGVAAAMRGVSTPYLHLSDVDDKTGFAVVADKDSGSGYKSRLVWLPEVVQKQMRYYENYLSATSKYLNLKTTKKKMPCCYFLDESGAIKEVRPKSLAPHLKQYLDLPANAARHWTCTDLRERGGGLSRETIDALMGHWWRGEEPWGPFSSFSYAAFRKEIADPISQIYTDLKFRPLQVSGRRGSER
jgi:integrase